MKTMIFAAGFGTRLQPLTLTTPKPLVLLKNRPILDWILDYLSGHQVEAAILNTHYLSEQIEAYAKSDQGKIALTTLKEEPEILGTGGGLFQAKDYFKEETDFLLCTSDILTDLDIVSFAKSHKSQLNFVTLALNQVKSRGMLLFDEEMILRGRINHETGEKTLLAGAAGELKEWGFSGFHMIHQTYFSLVAGQVEFDIINQYLNLAKAGQIIKGFDAQKSWFADIGSPEQLQQTEKLIEEKLG